VKYRTKSNKYLTIFLLLFYIFRGDIKSKRFYQVEWIDPWEPFYIAHRDHIHYDERFKQVNI